jgi:hypothetical protein
MEAWFASSWWLAGPLVAGVAYIAYEIHRQGGERPVSSRLVSLFVPTPGELAYKAVGAVILLIIWIVVVLITP